MDDDFKQIALQTIDKAIACGRVLQKNEDLASLNAAADRIEKLEAVLRQIVHEYDNTYDGDCDGDGRWTSAASIPVDVMERAKALLA